MTHTAGEACPHCAGLAWDGTPEPGRVVAGGYLTPGQALAWQRGKLDCKCSQCGFSSAATSQCNRCGSRALAYATHAEQGMTVKGGTGSTWCRNAGITEGKMERARRNREIEAAKLLADQKPPIRGGTGDATVA